MSANDRQVGGGHYKGEYQHWDYVIEADIPYMLACPLKYIKRWRSKNGLEDLKKAQHFLEKSIESDVHHIMCYESDLWLLEKYLEMVDGALEKEISKLIVMGDLSGALEALTEMIDQEEHGATRAYVDQ